MLERSQKIEGIGPLMCTAFLDGRVVQSVVHFGSFAQQFIHHEQGESKMVKILRHFEPVRENIIINVRGKRIVRRLR